MKSISLDAICAVSDAIRYVATSVDGHLLSRSNGHRDHASSSESDRYEELFVNPTILDLATRRAREGCGGLDHVIIRYGAFFQLLLPTAGGHVSVCIEPDANPLDLLPAIRNAAHARLDTPPLPSPVLVDAPFVITENEWMVDALPPLYKPSSAIRYVALQRHGRLLLSSRLADAPSSPDRSDRYEELIVNPTLLTLAGQRGRIDCGGLRYLVVAYQFFNAVVIPLGDGHATFSLPRDFDVVTIAPALETALRGSRSCPTVCA